MHQSKNRQDNEEGSSKKRADRTVGIEQQGRQTGESSYLSDKRCTLLVTESNSSTTTIEAPCTLENPNQCEDGECEGRPVDKTRVSLLSKNGPQGPGDGYGSWEITLRSGESIGRGGALKEESKIGIDQ